AMNRDGRLEVLAVNARTKAVNNIWQESPNSDWSGWSDLEGTMEPELLLIRDHAGYLRGFGVDVMRKCVMQRRQNDNGEGGWRNWKDLGGDVSPGLAVGQNLDGRLELFGVSRRNQRIVRAYQVRTNDAALEWTTWASFGPRVIPGLTMGQNAD